MKLALVGGQRDRPSATRVGAVPGLEAGLEMAEGDTLATAGQADGARVAHGLDPPRRAPEHRLEHDPRAVVELADDLVAGNEGERHDRLEVARGATVDGGQIGATDAGETRTDAPPARGGERGLVDVGELQRADPCPAAGAERPGEAGGGKARHRSLEDDGLHYTAPRSGALARARGSR